MKSLLGIAILATAAAVVLLLVDPTHVGVRFLAKLTIVILLGLSILSFVISRLFGAAANRNMFINLFLIGLFGIVGLAGAEAVARFAYRDVSTTGDNASYFARRWYSLHPPEINELGFREAPIPEKKSPGVYRIAVIGDSFAYGQGVLAEQRFSNLLDRELGKKPGRYEVLNFGRPGAETDDHLQIFNDVVVNLDPDFILLQWFVNDVEIAADGRDEPARLLPSSFAHSWLHSRSAVYYLINSQWISLQTNLGLTESYVDNMTRRFTDPDGEESRVAIDALDRLVRRVQEENVDMGIVVFPLMVEAHGNVDAYPLGFLMDRVMQFCSRNAVPCLDLRPAFADTLSAPGIWASRLDRHPGIAANQVASDAIYAYFGPTWQSRHSQ